MKVITRILVPTSISDLKELWNRRRRNKEWRRQIKEKGGVRLGGRFYPADEYGHLRDFPDLYMTGTIKQAE